MNLSDEVFFKIFPESVDPMEVFVAIVGRFGNAGLWVGDIFLV